MRRWSNSHHLKEKHWSYLVSQYCTILATVFCIYVGLLCLLSSCDTSQMFFFPQSIFIYMALESKFSKRFPESQGLTPNKGRGQEKRAVKLNSFMSFWALFRQNIVKKISCRIMQSQMAGVNIIAVKQSFAELFRELMSLCIKGQESPIS